VIFAGAGGTETWIERDRDSVVRIEVKAIAVATSDGGTLAGVASRSARIAPRARMGLRRRRAAARQPERAGSGEGRREAGLQGLSERHQRQGHAYIVWAADLKIQPEAEGGKTDEDPQPPAPEAERPLAAAA